MTAPGGDFKLAGAYVEVRLKDETSGDEKRIRAKIEGEKPVSLDTALKDPKNTRLIKEKIERETKPVLRPEVDEKSTRDSARKAGKGAEDELSRSARRANAQFDALKFLGLSVGLPAAAAVGAAGATASLALVAGGFAALGVYAASSSDQVQAAAKRMANGVLDDVTSMGSALEDDIVGALGHAGQAWDRLAPQVHSAVNASKPAVRELTGSVTDFAENAMPGMVTAVKASEPALKGLHSLASQAGTGLGLFFANAAQGSEGAQRGFVVLGSTVALLEARLGTLFANLARGSSGPLSSLYVLVDQATGALNDMTAQGSAAIGFLGGFTNTGVGAVSMLRLLVSLLSMLPPGIGQFAGSLTAAAMIANRFGVDVGAGFRGIGDQVRNAQGAGNKFTTFLGGLAGGFTPATLAVGAFGLLLSILGQKQAEAAERASRHTQAVNDMTEAYRRDNGVIGENVRQTALKALADKGAFHSNERLGVSMGTVSAAGFGQADALKTVNDSFRGYLTNLVQSHQVGGDVLDMVLRQADAYVKEGGSAEDTVDAMTARRMASLELSDAEEAQLVSTLKNVRAINEQAGASAEGARKAAELEAGLRKIESIAARGMPPAMYAAKAASADLEAAFETLNQTGGDVAAKGQAIIDVMLRLSGQTPSVEEALQAWNDGLRGIGESFKGANIPGHAKDLVDASGAINTVSDAGSKLQDTVQKGATDFAAYAQSLKDAGTPVEEIKGKLTGMRGEFAAQLKQLGLNDTQIGKILDHYGMLPDKVITQLGLEGDAETQRQLTDIRSQLAAVPDNKGIAVKALTDPAIRALGELGMKVVKLPDGTFRVFADTEPGRAAAAKLLNDVGNSDATATVFANTNPADSAVTNWKNVTTATVGNTTTYTSTDPATGAVRQWKATTDATGAITRTFSDINPATGAVRVWKQQADGTWAEAHARADVAAAEAALNHAARDRTAYIRTITVGTPGGGGGGSLNGPRVPNAQGNILKFFAGGGFEGLTPMSSMAQIVPPNTWRVVGDNMRVPESYIPLDPRSARSQRLLDETNARMGRTPVAGGGVTNHITVHTAAMEPYAVAAAVSAELGWAMRGG
ncbi:hypothetical protein DMH03_17715 [Amycolatopsis sp. WAC 01376]|uniref:hypothetical protein n=1 Tax=Amycolatopsis sp. WAC 01376 TaxID=2203195 RepID=UPI000F76E81E|nr:hypothetical protein [Amycolatopsis sp. WAC 01376]RSM60586.1 hypothetical protein DMH03_17715 [Amycolatopsis sp. WAC 01376]